MSNAWRSSRATIYNFLLLILSAAGAFQIRADTLDEIKTRGVLLWGADAEYVVVRPGDRRVAVAHKPASISHAEAAAASFAGLIASAIDHLEKTAARKPCSGCGELLPAGSPTVSRGRYPASSRDAGCGQ